MEHLVYLQGIKTALRAAKVTYAELARQLRMTESGVKKMLNAKDISFRRIVEICTVLNILPGQLLAVSEQTSVPEVVLTPNQESSLLRSRRLLAVYWQFAIEKREPPAIANQLSMNAAELKRHLDHLVRLGLLRIRQRRYAPRHIGKFRWADTSSLAATLNREWSQLVITRAIEPGQDSFHRLIALKLSRRSYDELAASFGKLLEEAVRTSEREELTVPQNDLVNVVALAAAMPKGIFDR